MFASPSFSTRPVAQLLSTCADRIVRHFVNRAALAHLQGLEDWALHDVGLERTTMERAVRGGSVAWN